MKQVTINLHSKNYNSIIKKGLFKDLDQYIDFSKETVIITDDNVYELYLQNFKYPSHIISTTPGEPAKSLNIYENIMDELIQKQYSRDVLIIAIGGGVIGDLAGFVASTYMRGVKYIQIPTTLLSQIDSSIGGKVALNHHNSKNIIGSFYHPDLVLIDPLFLQTLPPRQFNNGMAELIKYALIKDEGLFDKLLNEDPMDNICELIYQALIIKAQIVMEDEQDKNIRHLLNFGHTIGHAIEAYYNFEKYLHGEAVAIGMATMTKHQPFNKQIIKVLHKYHLPVSDKINFNELITFIQNDKKKINHKIKIVLLSQIGAAYLKTILIDDIKNYL